MNYAAVIAAGESLPSDSFIRQKLDEVDTIIAADGGFDVLLRLGLQADLLVGDFDSSSFAYSHPFVQEYIEKGKVLRYPVRKDETDTELALAYCFQRGAERVLLFGGAGSRMDHTMVNLALMKRFEEQGMAVVQYTANNVIRYLVPGVYSLPLRSPVWYTSFLLFSGESVLTLKGFDYSITHTTLRAGSSLAVSNHVLESNNEVRIESDTGCGVFCIQSRDVARASFTEAKEQDKK